MVKTSWYHQSLACGVCLIQLSRNRLCLVEKLTTVFHVNIIYACWEIQNPQSRNLLEITGVCMKGWNHGWYYHEDVPNVTWPLVRKKWLISDVSQISCMHTIHSKKGNLKIGEMYNGSLIQQIVKFLYLLLSQNVSPRVIESNWE